MSPRQLRQQIGQLLMAGFTGPVLPVEIESIAREFSLGGLVFFGRNVEEPAQIADVSRRAAELIAEGLPPWVAVDQEGGRVARFKKGFTLWPPMATLGRSGDVGLARRFASALAAELRAVGITLDFAPVLDVFTNSRNTVIGDRALADNAETAAAMGVAIIEAFEAAGLASCGKHFPGHGDTTADSHHDLPVAEHDLGRLREREFAPFRAAIRANVPALMTAHVLVPEVDDEFPGTLSRAVVQGLLRTELGFNGLVFTDDMEMKAVAARMPVPQACVQALAAGCDVVLVCSGNHDLQVETLEAIIRAVEQEDLPFARVEQALMRQRAAKERYLARQAPLAPQTAKSERASRQVLASEEHQAVAAEMARFA
jgi:beta-N-acetylhexosaminidase